MRQVCPTCGQPKRNKRGEGAAYALEEKRLNKKSIQILSWWLSNELLRQRELTKGDIQNGFKYVGREALNARMSELLGWRLVKLVDEDKGLYVLNLERVIKVLNAGGNTDILRQPPESLSSASKSAIT